ncbi:hypothetical protein [Empedobacter falsenii]|uniref:hypothetical protein n=1 Tax=Empedobacter falsenii TaxID=343874 RepID=UPI002577E662|nr:hypothetical protein [Empedobacter falsenii]MDM1319465.1 hypothetical protein [Empedobacter falsenii]
MKTLFNFFLLITFLLNSISYSQQVDTLNYVKQFEINKAKYIDQPFSVLLNDMIEIKPKTVWFTPLRNKNIIKTSRFKFVPIDRSFGNVVTLSITWKEYLRADQVKYLYQKNNFYFTNDEKEFYENKIIENILVYK